MSRRATVLCLATGVALIGAARLAIPGAPPLYDGVVVQEPYRYLTPEQGQAGSPTSFHATQGVTGATSPAFVAATAENPPQAQLVAPDGAFILPPATSSLDISIEAVAPVTTPQGKELAGNVYRIRVAGSSGAPLGVSGATRPTLVLRSPHPLSAGVIGQYVDGAWQELATAPAGQLGLLSANVAGLGDFAVLVASSTTTLGFDISPFVVGGALATVVAAIAILLLLRWDRGRTPARTTPAAGPGRAKRRPREDRRRRGGTR
jgi:hypothetical protein